MNEVFSWRKAPEGEYAVIGDPVSHSLSPKMHQAAYDALGLELRYRAIHVPVGEVGPALDRLALLGYRGINVTVPHKESALEWCSDAEPLAKKVRAANTLRLTDRVCINTDAPGFLDTLEELAISPGRVLLLGAGGSARAITYALAHEGWEIQIFNRTKSRAQEMLLGLEVKADLVDVPDPSGVNLILNTTSASLQGADLGILWDRADPQVFAYDLMYAKEPTPFMLAATNHGLSNCDGLGLLVAQGARSFEWWIGIPPSREAMRLALRP